MYMVRSGIVIEVDRFTQTGIIEDHNKNQFFFSLADCLEGDLPALWSMVTFLKDKDYKHTNVAMLVKKSNLKVG
jgi:hypothetical protein